MGSFYKKVAAMLSQNNDSVSTSGDADPHSTGPLPTVDELLENVPKVNEPPVLTVTEPPAAASSPKPTSPQNVHLSVGSPPAIPPKAAPPAPAGTITLETLAQQIYGLSQCVVGLAQRVGDNQRSFEANMRLNDKVMDLELKLKDANQRASNLDSLRDAMTTQLSHLNQSLRSVGGVSLDQTNLLDVTGPVEEQPGVQGEYESLILADAMSLQAPIVSDKLIPESGTLNLQNREMTVIPEDVYKLNDPELMKNVVGEGDNLKWWETEPIAKLYLCSNKISSITPAIAGLNSLTLLDLRDNQIESLPDVMSKLESLVRLELSHNKLSALPKSLGSSLQHLSLNNNNFEAFPEAVSSLSALTTLDIRENKITTIGTLPQSLQSLVADDNKLTSLTLEGHPNITALTANSNSITSCRVGNNPKLKVLAVKINKLEAIEALVNCPELQELLVGKNFITSLDFVAPVAGTLTLLDCSDNKVAAVPENIKGMTSLRRLDLTNNDLSNLPPELSLMDGLTSLAVEGNPLKTIRREIISKGTVAIKEYLKLKLDPAALEEEAGPTIPDIKPDEVMMKTKTMEIKGKSEIPAELWDQALVCGIVRLSLQGCSLGSVPEQVYTLRGTLKELELDQNNIKEISPEMGKMTKLRKLNLMNNSVKELPQELSGLIELEDLNMSRNKLSEIPEAVYSMKALCSLILSNNQIGKLDANKLIGLTSLVCIDLENNNLGRLPPELSLIPKLRTLSVMGNSFKIPRPDVLAKGSTEVIAWLKNRVPA